MGQDGGCCNNSSGNEWALVDGEWFLLTPGACTIDSIFMTDQDCDGMTCGGGFYHVGDFEEGSCDTPGQDCPVAAPRRWTPSNPGPNSWPPGRPARPGRPGGEHRGSTGRHEPPPGYPWGT